MSDQLRLLPLAVFYFVSTDDENVGIFIKVK
jgi:hypothetical protein